MATRVTPERWEELITQAEGHLSRPSATSEKNEAVGLASIAMAGTIDHTLLKLDATSAQIDHLCEEAKTFRFKSVCVRLDWVGRAVRNLEGTPVVVACVVGFHEGTAPSVEKALEAGSAVKNGAEELDMVINHVWLKENRYQEVYDDIAAVRNAALHPVVLKVILETSVLSREDIVAGCKIAEAAKADFVKTSTGFIGQGATIENVRLMRSVVGDKMKVKASGGIRTLKDVEGMLGAGAERIGASSGVAIMKEANTPGRGAEEVTEGSGVQESSGSY